MTTNKLLYPFKQTCLGQTHSLDVTT